MSQSILNQKLSAFVAKGSLDNVAKMIDKGVNLQQRGMFGDTLLHYAASNGQADILHSLARLGLDVNAKNDLGKTPLHCAAENGYVECVHRLIDFGADRTIRDNKGKAAIDYAWPEVETYFDSLDEQWSLNSMLDIENIQSEVIQF